MSTPQADPVTAADLAEARNAALKCAACAGGPAGYLEYTGVDGFVRHTAQALSGEPAIDRVSRLLVGESLVEYAGIRRASFHRIAWELAFQVHMSHSQCIGMLAAAGVKPPWDPDLFMATFLAVLGDFEARTGSGHNLMSDLRAGICFEYDRASNRLADAAGKPLPPLSPRQRNILEAVIANPNLTGEKLAPKAGYPCNSDFKKELSTLVKLGYLQSSRPGYVALKPLPTGPAHS